METESCEHMERIIDDHYRAARCTNISDDFSRYLIFLKKHFELKLYILQLLKFSVTPKCYRTPRRNTNSDRRLSSFFCCVVGTSDKHIEAQ